MSYTIDINCSTGDTQANLVLTEIPAEPYVHVSGDNKSTIEYLDTGSDNSLLVRPTQQFNCVSSQYPYRNYSKIPRSQQDPLAVRREFYTRRVEYWRKADASNVDAPQYTLPQSCSIRLASTVTKETTAADIAGIVLRTLAPIFPNGSGDWIKLQQLIDGLPRIFG